MKSPIQNLLKCDELTYLGHKINRDGIHPTDERVKAIQNMPSPSDVTTLRSFLGAVSQLGRFIPNLQTLCSPLHQLLQ